MAMVDLDEALARVERAEARVAELELGVRRLIWANDGTTAERTDIAWRDLKRLVKESPSVGESKPGSSDQEPGGSVDASLLAVGDTVAIGSEALLEYRHRVGVVREVRDGEARVEVRGHDVDPWIFLTQLHRIPPYEETAAKWNEKLRTNEACPLNGTAGCTEPTHWPSSADWPCSEEPEPHEARTERWRTGRTLGRTLYLGNDCIGIVDSPALAKDLVNAANASRSVDKAQTEERFVKKCAACGDLKGSAKATAQCYGGSLHRWDFVPDESPRTETDSTQSDCVKAMVEAADAQWNAAIEAAARIADRNDQSASGIAREIRALALPTGSNDP